MKKREYFAPVRHVVIDEFDGIDPSKIYHDVPPSDWPHWVRYNNTDERKRTCRDIEKLGPHINEAIKLLFRNANYFSSLTGLEVNADVTLHGGGVHVSRNGDYLGTHLDYAAHPHLKGYERRLNAIYYAVPEWKEEWGGATCLCLPDGETVVSRVYPKPGRLLLMETNDLAYHGTELVTCPDDVERVTIAVYFLSVIRPGTTRQRALFVPNRR